MNGSFVSLPYACELSITDYLIGYCDPLQTTASYYPGIGNDIEGLNAPAVIVACDTGAEVYGSNCYDMQVQISVKEMAADLSGSQLGVLSANIFNAICDPNMKDKINSASMSHSFTSLFIQKLDNRQSVKDDALVSEMALRVVGCISGSI